jgi:imidazolonepropionase
MNGYNLVVNANIITYISDKPIIKNSEDSLIKLKNSSILFNNNEIIDIGSYKEIKSKYDLNKVDNIVDVNNRWVFPGFVDCHTHLLFAGSRVEEFILRQKGYSYQDIAKAGGGIKYTVNKTINENYNSLKKILIDKIRLFKESNTKVIEIKNGYAIDIQKEIEHLELIVDVSKYVDMVIVPTFLAHIPPSDFENYLKQLECSAKKIRKLTNSLIYL